MQDRDAGIVDLGRALAHPARLRILRVPQAIPGGIGREIAETAGLAPSAVSGDPRLLTAADAMAGETSAPRICPAREPGALDPPASVVGAPAPPLGTACRLPDRKDA